MKTIKPDNRSDDPRRRHLETQLQELTKQYDQLTARIAALDTDIGREIDSERRMVLKQRRQEQSDERDQIGSQIVELERQIAEAITATLSRPTVLGHPSTGTDKTVASVSRSVFHRYQGLLVAGAGIFVVVILILLRNPLFRHSADVSTTTSVPAPRIRETEPVGTNSEATRTSTPAGSTPGTPITKGDVIITELDASKATRRYEFARRLEDDLKRRLSEYGLTNVTVAVSSQVVGRAEEAKSLAAKAEGTAVIWGWYDDLDVGIRVELFDETNISNLASTTQLPLLSAGEQSTELAVVVREVLPQNVSFLSLFVIGHLNYLANNYEAGHRAFDAAMDAMPAEARLENESVLHFFNARKLENSDAPADVIATICGYADAIQADPSFAASYNNLANIVSRRFTALPDEEWPSMPDAVADCLQRAGVDDVGLTEIPVKLYDQALEQQPGWALAEYNRVSYIWNQSRFFMCSPSPGKYYCLWDPEWLIEPLQSILEKDATFVGAHVILANLAFENSDYQAAREHFQRARTLVPDDARIQFNLAQTLGKLADPGAEDMFRQVLSQDETNYESALLLAALEYHEGNKLDALSLLELIPAAARETELLTTSETMAHILRSALLFSNEDISASIDQLEILVPLAPDDLYMPRDDSLLHYLLSLLYQSTGDAEASELHRSQVKTDIASSIWNESYFRVQNASIALTWFEIMKKCGSDGLESDCLPKETDARIRSLFDQVVKNFDERLYYNRGDLNTDYHDLGAACPYVYTIDPTTNEWKMETTILYHLVGRTQKQFQSRPLRNFDGRLLIREVEPETSYIDRLYVLVRDRSGQIVRLEAVGPHRTALSATDDHYLTLKLGNEVELQFPAYDPNWHTGPIQVIAQGYYDPLY